MMLPFANLIISTRSDPELCRLADRHYSRVSVGSNQFVLPGECLVLRDSIASVLFVWSKQKYRHDKQRGVYCQIFRNESERLSSDIIREAESAALRKWPDTKRFFTFINRACIQSNNPGYCFKMAGWTSAGLSKKHLIVLEKQCG